LYDNFLPEYKYRTHLQETSTGVENSSLKIWMALFGGTVPPQKVLFGSTVPPQKILFGGTVPPQKILFGGTYSHCTGYCGNEE